MRQTAVALKYVNMVRERGLGVVFITHNVRHAMAVGGRITVLNRGQTLGTAVRGTASHGGRCPKALAHKTWGSRLRSRGRTGKGRQGVRREALTMSRIACDIPPARPLARRIARAISMGQY